LRLGGDLACLYDGFIVNVIVVVVVVVVFIIIIIIITIIRASDSHQ